MKLALDLAYLRDEQPALLKRDAVPELLEREAVVLAFALRAGEPRCLARPDSAKESRERQVDSQSGVLQQVTVNICQFGELLSPIGKVFLLRVLTDTLARRLVQKLALVEQTVVDKPQGVQCRIQRRLLRPRWKKPVPETSDFDVIAVHTSIVPKAASKHNRQAHFVRAKASVSETFGKPA